MDMKSDSLQGMKQQLTTNVHMCTMSLKRRRMNWASSRMMRGVCDVGWAI